MMTNESMTHDEVRKMVTDAFAATVTLARLYTDNGDELCQDVLTEVLAQPSTLGVNTP